MSRHIKFCIPACATIADVATALAIAGNAEKSIVESGSDSWVEADVRIDPSIIPGVAFIEFQGGVPGEIRPIRLKYEFEFGQSGRRGMHLPDDPVVLAMAWKVIEHLGGELLANEEPIMLDRQSESRWLDEPSGNDFIAMQQFLAGITGITDSDVGRCSALIGAHRF